MTSEIELPPDTEPPADAVPATQPAAPRRSGWAALRPLVLRLHFFAGILIAPFLLVATVSGLLYATSYQLEKIVYAHELTVPAGKAMVPLSQQVAAARAELPRGTVVAVRPAPEPGRTTRVMFDTPEVADPTTVAVFVDPHTAKVRGVQESYGSSGALPLRAWLSNLHRHLHMGETGRLYSELAASWLWVVALGGLLLWLTRRRDTRRVRALVAPDRTATGRRRTMSWHGAVGVWVLPVLLFLSVTGLTWSGHAGENITKLREAMNWTTPAVSASAGDHAEHGGGAGHAGGHGTDTGVDGVAQAAAQHGLSGPLEIVWPGEPGAAYVVKEIDKQWPVRLDQVAVDANTAQVTDTLAFADWPLAAKLTRWGIDFHMGILFGPPNEILLVAVAAGLLALVLWGYRMWWQRRPTRAFGRPYPRGSLRQVPLPILLPLAAVTVVVGVFLPLLGISLVVFLALDVLLGWRARRRAAATRAAGT